MSTEMIKDGEGSTVVVGMSGGVDSSVAALRLQQRGYRVIGLFMKNWEDDDDDEYCSTREDLVDVASVCDRLGIDLEVVNFSAEYKARVFADFLREYEAGRTPNPDILCNSEIKFRCFLDHAMTLGAERIATGHYAQVRLWNNDGRSEYQLLKAEDGTKDQSYFLYRLNQRQLARTLFPLGDLYKRDVRRIAEAAGLHVHDKKDSTGICFIGERPFREFLQRYLPARPGEIRTLDGDRVIGEHQGLMYHTIGQRQGLGIGGLADHDEAPWYVVDKDLQRNILLVAQGNDHPALFKSSLYTREILWIAGREPELPMTCKAKVRYRQPDQACTVRRDGEAYRVDFEQRQRAVTPGQSVVFYQGELCLGGGVIEQTTE